MDNPLSEAEQKERARIAKFGLLLFFIADGMLFAGLAAAWIVLRAGAGTGNLSGLSTGIEKIVIGLFLLHLLGGLFWVVGSVLFRKPLS